MIIFTVAPKQVTFIVHPGASKGSTTSMQLLSYFQNDEEPELLVNLLDEMGSPYDLTDVDQVHLLVRRANAPLPLLVDGPMTVDPDRTLGKATYTWPNNLLAAPGRYIGEVSLRYGKPTQAKGAIALIGTASAPGLLQILIGDVTVNVAVTLGMTAEQAVTAAITAVNDHATVQATASAHETDPAKIVLTAKPEGVAGNALTYYVDTGTLAAGLTAAPTTATAMSGGISPTIRTRTLGQFQIDVIKSIATA